MVLALAPAVVHLVFTDTSAAHFREVAAEAILLRGAEIERQPEAEPVAFAANGCWEIDKHRFTRAECSDKVVCLFEEDGEIGEKQGPFEGLAMQEGILRSAGTIIAVLRGTYWQSATTRRAWPRIRVIDVPLDRAGSTIAGS